MWLVALAPLAWSDRMVVASTTPGTSCFSEFVGVIPAPGAVVPPDAVVTVSFGQGCAGGLAFQPVLYGPDSAEVATALRTLDGGLLQLVPLEPLAVGDHEVAIDGYTTSSFTVADDAAVGRIPEVEWVDVDVRGHCTTFGSVETQVGLSGVDNPALVLVRTFADGNLLDAASSVATERVLLSASALPGAHEVCSEVALVDLLGEVHLDSERTCTETRACPGQRPTRCDTGGSAVGSAWLAVLAATGWRSARSRRSGGSSAPPRAAAPSASPSRPGPASRP